MCDSEDIASLRDEIRLLREVLDEVLEELSWANNNAVDLPEQVGAISAFRRITSMSLDPTVRDFQVNAVDPATVAMLREQALKEVRSQTHTQRSLF
jgi:hypothetical protein